MERQLAVTFHPVFNFKPTHSLASVAYVVRELPSSENSTGIPLPYSKYNKTRYTFKYKFRDINFFQGHSFSKVN